MLKITSESRLFIANQALDFRKGMDRTLAYIQELKVCHIKSGALFVFFNRNRTLARVVCYDGTGFWLANKRLSRGTFASHPKSSSGATNMSGDQLLKLLQCICTNNDFQKACV